MTGLTSSRTELSLMFFSNPVARLVVALLMLAFVAPVLFGADARRTEKRNRDADGRTAISRAVVSASSAKREMEGHDAQARYHEIRAAAFRDEISARWERFENDKRRVAVIAKMAVENPHLKKLRQQAEQDVIALRLEILPAEEMAQYHRQRARELADED